MPFDGPRKIRIAEHRHRDVGQATEGEQHDLARRSPHNAAHRVYCVLGLGVLRQGGYLEASQTVFAMDKSGYRIGFIEDGMRHPCKNRDLAALARQVDKKERILDLLLVVRTKVAWTYRYRFHLQRRRMKG
jgi:hypothetical protein